MVQQMNAEPETNLDSNAAKEALLVYHDDSDELNEELDEMLMPVSDTDNEDWEQVSYLTWSPCNFQRISSTLIWVMGVYLSSWGLPRVINPKKKF